MAFRKVELGVALVLFMVVLLGRATAQSSCSNSLMNLTPCLSYITGNSSSNPSSSCCSNLASVVQSSPQCLCSVLNGGATSFGITVNRTLALSLPGSCKVNTPPLNQCNAANSPTGSAIPPVTSPSADSPSTTPDASITPSASNIPSGVGGGSKSVPSTDGNSSWGTSIKAPMNVVLFLVFILSCSSNMGSFLGL
ncbi:non-specific lipid transfer protein GPI-anchored 5-like [Humulus lupulus]|uniref:non-specific lipid transfer protein GPI-anchored 5-like n=1 Tax=Humulus lupulus TaxID=3486 RepID=UPI002B40EA82|nr:non-specific lipid transfer protein GPI-anchored 5-like [Humulus lupulus]